MSSKPAIRSKAFLQARLVAEGLVVLALLVWWLTAQQLPDSVFPSPVNVFVELGRLAAACWGYSRRRRRVSFWPGYCA